MNTSLQLVVLICVYCIHTSYALPGASDDWTVPGTPVPFNLARFKRSTEIACDATKPQKQCASDCRTLLFCNGGTIIGKVSCPEAKPDCDLVSHTCVEKRPTDQCPATAQRDYSCPGREGYFPDPTNCRIYNYCDGGNVAQKYTCPLYYAFDMDLGMCRRGAPCGIINCYLQNFARHSTYSHLYAFCSNNAVIQGSYSMCPQISQEFDINSFECLAKCKTEGNIPHEQDCNKYYRCLASGYWGTLEKTTMLCPPGQNFNKEKFTCDKVYKCEVPIVPEIPDTPPGPVDPDTPPGPVDPDTPPGSGDPNAPSGR